MGLPHTFGAAPQLRGRFPPPQTRHFGAQPSFGAGGEHGQFQGAQGGPGPFAVGQSQHPFPPGQPVPVSYAGSQQIRGEVLGGTGAGGLPWGWRGPLWGCWDALEGE